MPQPSTERGRQRSVAELRAHVMLALIEQWAEGEPFEVHIADDADLRVEIGEQTFRLRIEEIQ